MGRRSRDCPRATPGLPEANITKRKRKLSKSRLYKQPAIPDRRCSNSDDNTDLGKQLSIDIKVVMERIYREIDNEARFSTTDRDSSSDLDSCEVLKLYERCKFLGK